SVCFQLFVRIDGPQSTCTAVQVMVSAVCVARWQPFWTNQSVNETAGSGMRGATAIPAENIIIVGGEGTSSTTSSNDVHLWSVPLSCISITAGTAALNTTCATHELSVKSDSPSVATLTGFTPGSVPIPFNRAIPFYDNTG